MQKKNDWLGRRLFVDYLVAWVWNNNNCELLESSIQWIGWVVESKRFFGFFIVVSAQYFLLGPFSSFLWIRFFLLLWNSWKMIETVTNEKVLYFRHSCDNLQHFICSADWIKKIDKQHAFRKNAFGYFGLLLCYTDMYVFVHSSYLGYLFARNSSSGFGYSCELCDRIWSADFQ